MRLKQIPDLIKKSVTAWLDDYAPSMGAAIAYYTLFAITPLLIIAIAVTGFVFCHAWAISRHHRRCSRQWLSGCL